MSFTQRFATDNLRAGPEQILTGERNLEELIKLRSPLPPLQSQGYLALPLQPPIPKAPTIAGYPQPEGYFSKSIQRGYGYTQEGHRGPWGDFLKPPMGEFVRQH